MPQMRSTFQTHVWRSTTGLSGVLTHMVTSGRALDYVFLLFLDCVCLNAEALLTCSVHLSLPELVLPIA